MRHADFHVSKAENRRRVSPEQEEENEKDKSTDQWSRKQTGKARRDQRLLWGWWASSLS